MLFIFNRYFTSFWFNLFLYPFPNIPSIDNIGCTKWRGYYLISLEGSPMYMNISTIYSSYIWWISSLYMSSIYSGDLHCIWTSPLCIVDIYSGSLLYKVDIYSGDIHYICFLYIVDISINSEDLHYLCLLYIVDTYSGNIYYICGDFHYI